MKSRAEPTKETILDKFSCPSYALADVTTESEEQSDEPVFGERCTERTLYVTEVTGICSHLMTCSTVGGHGRNPSLSNSFPRRPDWSHFCMGKGPKPCAILIGRVFQPFKTRGGGVAAAVEQRNYQNSCICGNGCACEK